MCKRGRKRTIEALVNEVLWSCPEEDVEAASVPPLVHLVHGHNGEPGLQRLAQFFRQGITVSARECASMEIKHHVSGVIRDGFFGRLVSEEKKIFTARGP